MARGIGDIIDLHLVTLNKLITKFTASPNLILQNMFPSDTYPSDMIEWDSYTGGRGMTPFKAPGSPTPVGNMLGYQKHFAKAAFWGQKMYFDEEFLNNLRQLGTREGYETAQKRLAKELRSMTNRARRRKEWMFAQMLFAGSFNYCEKDGFKASVDYQIPSANVQVLAAENKWGTGSAKDIIGDIIGAKRQISDSCGSVAGTAIMNSLTLEYVARDVAIQTLLQKSTFGNGDLFSGNVHNIVGVNPKVLGSLLNIANIIIYDELYEARGITTGAITASSTTSLTVDEGANFVPGTATIRHINGNRMTEEDITISAVNTVTSTLTIATTTNSFPAGCTLVQKVKFCPDNLFVLMANSVEDEPIAEYLAAPYGLNRGYGLRADRDYSWDPEGVWIRVQDKGIPVLYHRDAIYRLTVE